MCLAKKGRNVYLILQGKKGVVIKMNLGKIIKDIVGKQLAEEGFVYDKKTDIGWQFVKKGSYDQIVNIAKYRFGGMLFFEISVDRWGTGVIQASEIDEVESNSEMKGFWTYGNEEELVTVLNQMCFYIKKYGLKLLDEICNREESVWTQELHNRLNKRLYEQHDELCERFINRTGLSATGFDEANINTWFPVIENEVNPLQSFTMEQAEEPLLEIAAFLGSQLVKYMGGSWSVSEDEDILTSVNNIQSQLNYYSCINRIAGCYLKEIDVVDIRNDFLLIFHERYSLHNEMNTRLYERHDELCERFLARTGVSVAGFNEADINIWFSVIEKEMKEIQNLNMEQAQETLVEIAAFLGNQLVKYKGGHWWIYNEYDGKLSAAIKDIQSFNHLFVCLNQLIWCYKKDCEVAQMKQRFLMDYLEA